MYVAWRDLRSARGRFALIAAVVALITLLVGGLAGLTGGLAAQNVSALLSLPADRLVLAAPDGEDPSVTGSALEDEVVAAWQDAPGVRTALPVGIAQGRATAGDREAGVAVLGVPAGAEASAVTDLAPGGSGRIGLSAGAAVELGVAPGDTVAIAGEDYRVDAVGADASLSHTPVVVLDPADWSALDARLGGDGAPSLLAVTGSADWEALAASTGTSARTPLGSLGALETFRSEIGSLGLMIGLLLLVSVLVVGAFFTVWTLQRSGDIAVLKALGAGTPELVRDTLGQALVVLAAGVTVGTGLVVLLGRAAEGAVPFVLDPLTTLLPALLLMVLGLVGSAAALRTVVAADPLSALGSAR